MRVLQPVDVDSGTAATHRCPRCRRFSVQPMDGDNVDVWVCSGGDESETDTLLGARLVRIAWFLRRVSAAEVLHRG